MFIGALESLGQLMGAADPSLFAAEEAKKELIGLARDLRGLAYAFNTKTSYMMLFDWMYPFVNNILILLIDTLLQMMCTNVYVYIYIYTYVYYLNLYIDIPTIHQFYYMLWSCGIMNHKLPHPS